MAQEVEHVLGKDEVTSSNLVISSKKNVPYNEGRFFWSWGASPPKTSLTTRDVFLEPGGISVKSTPNKEECFFFRCVSFSSKNTSKNLDLNYLPSGFSQ